jgi:RNA polymerase-binding transcription factor DksA
MGVDLDFLPRLDRLLAHRYSSLLGEIRYGLAHSEDRSDLATAVLMGELQDHSAADLLADLCKPGFDLHLAELRHILRARRRIRQGTYGICDVCGARMPASWLETHLTAQLCLECDASARHSTP